MTKFVVHVPIFIEADDRLEARRKVIRLLEDKEISFNNFIGKGTELK